MRKLLLIFAVAMALAIGCVSKEKKLTAIAEKYTLDVYGPLFPNSTILPDYVEPGFHYMNDVADKMILINTLDSLEFENKIRLGNKLNSVTKKEYRFEMIKRAVFNAQMKALDSADANEGFYIVATCLHFKDSTGYQVLIPIDIIADKNLKIANKPVDLKGIDSAVNEMPQLQ